MGITAHADVRVRFPQQQAVPLGGHYNVYLGPAGEGVDYATAVNPSPIPAWPDGEAKIGWGLGCWGQGAWGIGSGGIGWGKGGWGLGPWGFGTPMTEFICRDVADGDRLAGVLGFDQAGNESAEGFEAAAAVAGTPEPPSDLKASEYDGETDELTLEWELSDDEG